jgi:hypothetical protein
VIALLEVAVTTSPEEEVVVGIELDVKSLVAVDFALSFNSVSVVEDWLPSFTELCSPVCMAESDGDGDGDGDGDVDNEIDASVSTAVTDELVGPSRLKI